MAGKGKINQDINSLSTNKVTDKSVGRVYGPEVDILKAKYRDPSDLS